MTQTVEQFLFEQLQRIAPGKYTRASVLTREFRGWSGQGKPCSHLKGGRGRSVMGKDYNLSAFTFVNGVTEIKCLYNCGLRFLSTDPETREEFRELVQLMETSTTNTPASSESNSAWIDPRPAPTYTEEQRREIREYQERAIQAYNEGIESGEIELPSFNVDHPDPVEAPDSIIEREMVKAFEAKKGKPIAKPLVKPLKIRKRKKQSRIRGT